MWFNRKSLEINTVLETDHTCVKKTVPAQWNQSLSGLVCACGFLVIFGLMLFFTIKQIKDQDDDEALALARGRVFEFPVKNSNKCLMSPKCMIKCEDIQVGDNLTEFIHEIYKESVAADCEMIIQSLIIEKFAFPNNVLTEGWFYSPYVEIQKLRIENGRLDYIKAGAFSDNSFKILDELTFVKIIFFNWKSNMLSGLTILRTFNVRDCNILNIEPDCLASGTETMEVFQINDMKNTLDPVNITGTNKLNRVKNIDLRFNGILSISSKTFEGVPNCLLLHLSYNNIEYIEEGAFSYLKNLETIYLNVNNLQIIPSTIFSPNNVRLKNVHLSGNDWNCNCELEWLQELTIVGKIGDEPTCLNPLSAKNKTFLEVDFCSEDNNLTSSTMTQTISTLTQTMSTPIESAIDIICHSEVMRSNEIELINRGFTISHAVAEQAVDFMIQDENEIGTVSIHIMSDDITVDILMWFNGHLDFKHILNSTVGCITQFSNGVRIKLAKLGEPYTFCLLTEAEMRISPFDCRAHTSPLPWSRMAFLRNEDIPLVAGLAIVCMVVFMIFGAVIVFIIVRRNPSLLRGSKRIVMVKHRNAEALVLPPNIEEGCHKGACRYGSEPKKPSIRARKPVGIRRSVSETSIFSSKSVDASYVSAAEPTPVQLLNWRLERLRNTVETSAQSATIPPPLPPRIPRKPCSPLALPFDFDNLSGISEV